MSFLQALKMAVKSILSNKVRSFLTMLGVIIGVGSVIAAVAFAQGSTKSITDQIEKLGSNLITISITGRNSNRQVTYEDLLAFSEENSELITAVTPRVSGRATVKFGTKTSETTINGSTPEYQITGNVNVQEGRFLTVFDVDLKQKVVVLGITVANNLFSGIDPIGQSVKINGQMFTVIGVLEEKGSTQADSTDDQVIIPVSQAQRLLRNSIIGNFSVQTTEPEFVDSIMEKLNTFLFKVYKSTNAFRVNNSAQMLSTLGNITGTLMLVLGGIATISLVVGGIGIMNIMLVSVTERTREIGIRKAIGAKKTNILIQFLIEAIIVTGIGGIMGVFLGISVIHFILGGMKLVPEVYSPLWITLSFSISLVIGIIFGIFPAYKAANLNPIEALRYE